MSRSIIYVDSDPQYPSSPGKSTDKPGEQFSESQTLANKVGRQLTLVDPDLSVVGGNNMDSSRSAPARRRSVAANSTSNQLAIPQEQDQSSVLRRARVELYFAVSLLIIFVTLFVLGNRFWDERYYIPEEGLGYYLGLTGGSMMLIAFGYTAFKYSTYLRSRAIMKHWLTIHIFFGVAGPLLVLFHSTFRFGSLNGGIALVATCLVFASGVMARFIYARTHYGLGGQKERVKDLQEKLVLSGLKIKSKRLDRFTEKVIGHRDSLTYAVWDFMTFGWRSRWVYFRLSESMRHHLAAIAKVEGWDAEVTRLKHSEFKNRLRDYIFTLKKVALFGVYERFFAFWRNAHVPLLYLLLMSGIVHVIAVHMY